MDALARLQSLDLRAWQRRAVQEATPERPVPVWLTRHLASEAAASESDEAGAAAELGAAAPVAAGPQSEEPDLDGWVVPGVPRPEGSAEPVGSAVLAVQEAVEALAAESASGRPQDVAAVLVLAERLRGLALREVSELDVSGQFADAGAASAAVWLRDTMVLSDDTARFVLRLAGRLRSDLPAVGQALCDGTTTQEHARAVAAGTTGLDPQVVAQAQPGLLDLIAVADPHRVRRELRERAQAIDPHLGADAERRRQARQGFYADAISGGGVALGGQLADEDGAVLLHGLDLAVAADRQSGDTRGLPARRAAVLVQWARQAATTLGGSADSLAQDARTVRSHLLITCTLDQLHALRTGNRPGDAAQDPAATEATAEAAAELALLSGADPSQPARWPTGAPVQPAALRRLACDSTLTLVLAQTGRPGRHGPQPARVEPLYVGRSSRTVTGAQLKALVVRDRHCIVKGCRRRPAQCQAHHVRHWLDGGTTDLDNLVLLCHQHHHDHHDRGHDLQHRDGRWLTTTGWGPGASPP